MLHLTAQLGSDLGTFQALSSRVRLVAIVLDSAALDIELLRARPIYFILCVCKKLDNLSDSFFSGWTRESHFFISPQGNHRKPLGGR